MIRKLRYQKIQVIYNLLLYNPKKQNINFDYCRSGASEGTTLYNETLQPTFIEIFTTFLGAQWKEICIFYGRFTTFLGAALYQMCILIERFTTFLGATL